MELSPTGFCSLFCAPQIRRQRCCLSIYFCSSSRSTAVSLVGYRKKKKDSTYSSPWPCISNLSPLFGPRQSFEPTAEKVIVVFQFQPSLPRRPAETPSLTTGGALVFHPPLHSSRSTTVVPNQFEFFMLLQVFCVCDVLTATFYCCQLSTSAC